MLPPEVVAPIQSVTATSVMGWGGFLFSLIACSVLVWKEITGRGKSLAVIDGKIEHLSEQMEEMDGKLAVVDGLSESVRELAQEWRGVPGSGNGYRSIINKNTDRINAIEKRNQGIDAVRDEDFRRSHGQQRRHMDRELNNLMPEEREEKP